MKIRKIERWVAKGRWVAKFVAHLLATAALWVRIRVRPFRLKIFFAYKRNTANLDPFHMCFTISL